MSDNARSVQMRHEQARIARLLEQHLVIEARLRIASARYWSRYGSAPYAPLDDRDLAAEQQRIMEQAEALEDADHDYE